MFLQWVGSPTCLFEGSVGCRQAGRWEPVGLGGSGQLHASGWCFPSHPQFGQRMLRHSFQLPHPWLDNKSKELEFQPCGSSQRLWTQCLCGYLPLEKILIVCLGPDLLFDYPWLTNAWLLLFSLSWSIPARLVYLGGREREWRPLTAKQSPASGDLHPACPWEDL